MKIDLSNFRPNSKKSLSLKDWPTRIKEISESKSEYKDALEAGKKELNTLQGLLYASHTYSLLIIFQAMDAAGKDSAIKHVLSGVNPQGCEVYSFKEPSSEELAHDFLWRNVKCLPERGRIGIFNRSYYEEVLVAKVHPEILKRQNLPEEILKKNDFWEDRYNSINNFEEHLHKNGTRIIKIHLHLSKEEQRKRFLDRIDNPEKNWKFSKSDIQERKLWKEYMAAYEACIEKTNSDYASWFIVPADHKETARLIISQIIIEEMRSLKLKFPKSEPKLRDELKSIRAQLDRAEK